MSMFHRLKQKIAEESGIAARPGGAAHIPRSISKESITSVGADSGDDFASDGSNSRDDLPSQISRRNDHIRRLEAKLSDYAEQVRTLQKMKDKLEYALEKHQDSSMRKLQDQNEAHQAHRAKMAEEHAQALEKKDQECMVKLANLEEEKKQMSHQLDLIKKQSFSLFQKRDDLDELEVFQQQEMAKIKHMLLKKEELLAKANQELELLKSEVELSRIELHDAQELSSGLRKNLGKLQEENDVLSEQRTQLTFAQEGAEKKITELEQRQQELQDFIQRLSLDLQKAQAAACSSAKSLSEVQEEFEALKLQHEQLKSKVAGETEEKDLLIARLQERVSSLEKTLEGSLSGEEGLQELLKEKDALEMRLDDTRQQLLETKTQHSDTITLMGSETAKLKSTLQETLDLLQNKNEEFKHFKEESSLKVHSKHICILGDLEQALQAVRERLQEREEELKQKEEQMTSCQSQLSSETSKLKNQLQNVKQQCADKVERLETQISAMENARDIDKTSALHSMGQLEQEIESLKHKNDQLEEALRKHEADQEKMKEELSSRETVSVEIAKALEETRKQKEELQQQVTDLTVLIEDGTKELSQKQEKLNKKDEETAVLKGDYDALVLQMQQLQADLDVYKVKASQSEESIARLQEQREALQVSESQVSSLQEEVSALHERLHGTGNQVANGEVAEGDIVQLQKENQHLEEQVAEKNKTIKQLQQRMAELKKTLQKELKLKPESEVNDLREKLNPDPPAPTFTVTSSSDLNDSREINFEYLKHVVLKFMSARETEALHLIKAVSVLLNFSVEEENLLKETLEYKMSWFGSKPSPKGSARPSISGPRTAWS
ncbi:golgin subfamily A member 1 [Gastrophryne carolinensis]